MEWTIIGESVKAYDTGNGVILKYHSGNYQHPMVFIPNTRLMGKEIVAPAREPGLSALQEQVHLMSDTIRSLKERVVTLSEQLTEAERRASSAELTVKTLRAERATNSLSLVPADKSGALSVPPRSGGFLSIFKSKKEHG